MLIKFMKGSEWPGYFVMFQQNAGFSGILGEDHIDPFEDFQSPEGNVSQVSDWCGYQCEFRHEPLDKPSLDKICQYGDAFVAVGGIKLFFHDAAGLWQTPGSIQFLNKGTEIIRIISE